METAARPQSLNITQPIRELEAQITRLAGHLNAGNHRFLMLIAEFDRRDGWSDSATQSCAHWLNWKCGIDIGAAREKVRVAHALEGLPRISASMARGELSYAKVRALTRVARPETEELLLTIALHGTAHHVETTVRCFRRVQQAEELSREAQQQAARYLTYRYGCDGSLIFKGSLPAETGALLLKALDALLTATEPTKVSAETSPANESPTPGERPSWGMRRADALGRIVESFLAHGAEVLSSGDRNQLVVHVDAKTLSTGGDGCCEHEDGPALPVETARRLMAITSVTGPMAAKRSSPTWRRSADSITGKCTKVASRSRSSTTAHSDSPQRTAARSIHPCPHALGTSRAR